MVNHRTLGIALASVALLAASAVADARWSLEPEDPGQSAPQQAAYVARSRQVEVFRAPSSLRSPEAANFSDDDDDAPPVPRVAEMPRLKPASIRNTMVDAQPPQETLASCDDCTQCNSCGMDSCNCCCTPFWAHRNNFWGELLYLQPTGVDMAHAIQQNGVGGPGTTPQGRVATVAPIFTPAFRVGFSRALGLCSSIGVSYANFYSHATDTEWAGSGVGDTIASLVLHPESINAGSTSSLVEAQLDVDFKLVDIDYRRLIWGTCNTAVNYDIGLRYGKLGQFFNQVGQFAPPIGTMNTSTSIKFEGLGIKTGLDGLRQIGCSGVSVYGKGFVSVLFGDFNSAYTQLDTTTTIVQATSNWRDNRAVPILEYEVGVNWTSPGGCLRLSSGYYTAYWFNTITTGEYVQAVQYSDFVFLGQTTTFEGFVSRAEFRF